MRVETDLPGYETPFRLFGNAPPTGAVRSLSELIKDGLLAARDADALVALARRPVSLVIVAPGAACGKSSLLAALLPYLPVGRDRYFLRGSFETFRFARAPAWRPDDAVLIANEISDHLPVYLPNHQRRRLFTHIAQGACLWATAHASDLDDLLGRWPEWPKNAPLAVATIRGDENRLTIGVHDPTGAPRKPGDAIDSVCHAESGTGSGADALPVRVPASGLRPCQA